MSNPFHSSKYSIEHAKRRLREFEGEIGVFFKSDPYASVVEVNADATEDVHKVKLIKPMPVGLPGIAFDIVGALRSALDQAGYAVAVAAGTRAGDAHFPFGSNLTEVQNRIHGRSKDIPQKIFDLMVSFQPYKGGNDFLWALNKLCNSQKHEIVIPAALYTGGSHIGHTYFDSVIEFGFPPYWDRTKNEMIIARVPHGAACHIDLQIQQFIAIGEIEAVRGQPAVAVLNKLVSMVESIVAAIEAEARRIKLIL